jgi:hypothetical protein
LPETLLQTGAQGIYFYIQWHTHCPSYKQAGPNQNKKKEKENTFLLCQVCLSGNESLNKYCHFSGDSIGFEVVPHSPYNLALAPSDFWLFTAFKKHLKGIHVTCEEEIQAVMEK